MCREFKANEQLFRVFFGREGPPTAPKRKNRCKLPADQGILRDRERFAVDCNIRQAVSDFRVLCGKIENITRVCDFVRIKSSGESQFRPAAGN